MTRTAPRTPYEILGVSAFDDRAAIRSAWKRLVRENHPDRCPADAARLTRRLAELNAAYDKLRHHVPAPGRAPRNADTGDATRTAAQQAGAQTRADAHRRAQAKAEAHATAQAAGKAEKQAKAAAAKPRAAKARSRKAPEAPALSPAQRAALHKATASFSTARAAFEKARPARVAIDA
ncbi:MAG: J domain-containing protein [Sagittula sp.]|uniref:J domain-containing protein n=1 Tax=Sagittula sp. TaxID=2038081 RepID=UPI004059993B